MDLLESINQNMYEKKKEFYTQISNIGLSQ